MKNQPLRKLSFWLCCQIVNVNCLSFDNGATGYRPAANRLSLFTSSPENWAKMGGPVEEVTFEAVDDGIRPTANAWR